MNLSTPTKNILHNIFFEIVWILMNWFEFHFSAKQKISRDWNSGNWVIRIPRITWVLNARDDTCAIPSHSDPKYFGKHRIPFRLFRWKFSNVAHAYSSLSLFLIHFTKTVRLFLLLGILTYKLLYNISSCDDFHWKL